MVARRDCPAVDAGTTKVRSTRNGPTETCYGAIEAYIKIHWITS